MESDAQRLKKLYKKQSQNCSDDLRLKLHRAISWLEAAETHSEDSDMSFIGFWISFNAVYADKVDNLGDRGEVKRFLDKICALDSDKKLYSLIWDTFANNIRILLNNKFAFQPFWDSYNEKGAPNEAKWKKQFDYEKSKVAQAIAKQDTAAVLNIVFRRLYTIRNQILHGGATYKSSVNIRQKKDACSISAKLIPAVIEIVLMNSGHDWGTPYYPLVKN